MRKSVATAFFTIFNQNIVPKAVQREELEITPPGTLEGFAERLSVKLEQALFEKFALSKDQSNSNKKAKGTDVGPKYRTKFRSLSVILKDDKNPDLHRRIVTGELTPEEFVTLSRDELMNPALRKMAEAVRAESIRNSILVVDDGPRIRRTHKGEEYIDDAFENQPEQDWKSAPKDKSNDPDKDQNTEEQENETATIEDETKSKSPSMVTFQEPLIHGNDTNNDLNNADYAYDDDQRESGMDIEDDDDLDAILNGAKSTGKIKNPELSNKAEVMEDDDDYDPFLLPTNSGKSTSPPSEETVVYTGQVVMNMVSEFPGTAIHLSGPKGFDPYNSWNRVINATSPLAIEGRLDCGVAAKYLRVVGQTKEIVSFILRSDEPNDTPQFNKLFDYFSSKNKYGVIVKAKPSRSFQGPQLQVKDAYLITLKEGDPIPDYLWLTSQESQLLLESRLMRDKRVAIGLFVLANRVIDIDNAHRSAVSSAIPGTTASESGSISNASLTNPQALLSLLQQMNDAPATQPTQPQYSYSQQSTHHPSYSVENDDDYEP